jgi:DNA-binding HxlR family transcriptional regulator
VSEQHGITGKPGVNQALISNLVSWRLPTDCAGKSDRLLLDQFADKWTILILKVLCTSGGKARFNGIRRRIGGISQKTLSQCLRRLERDGVIERAVLDTAPIGMEYSITPLGRTLEIPFKALYDWAAAYLPEVETARARYDSRVTI